MRLSDICNLLGRDWIPLAQCLEIPDSDLNLIDNEYPDNTTQQAMVMLKLWMAQSQNKVTGNNEVKINSVEVKFSVLIGAILRLQK